MLDVSSASPEQAARERERERERALTGDVEIDFTIV